MNFLTISSEGRAEKVSLARLCRTRWSVLCFLWLKGAGGGAKGDARKTRRERKKNEVMEVMVRLT